MLIKGIDYERFSCTTRGKAINGVREKITQKYMEDMALFLGHIEPSEMEEVEYKITKEYNAKIEQLIKIWDALKDEHEEHEGKEKALD